MEHRDSRSLPALALAFWAALVLASAVSSGGALAQSSPASAGRGADAGAQCRDRLNRVTEMLRSGRLVPRMTGSGQAGQCPDINDLERTLEAQRTKYDSYVKDFQLLLSELTAFPAFKQSCSRITVRHPSEDLFIIEGSVSSPSGLTGLLERLKSTLKTVKIEIELKTSPGCWRSLGASKYVLMEDEKGQVSFVSRKTLTPDQIGGLPSSDLCEEIGELLLQAAKDDAERDRFRTGFWSRAAEGAIQACSFTGDGWEAHPEHSSIERYAVILRAENP